MKKIILFALLTITISSFAQELNKEYHLFTNIIKETSHYYLVLENDSVVSKHKAKKRVSSNCLFGKKIKKVKPFIPIIYNYKKYGNTIVIFNYGNGMDITYTLKQKRYFYSNVRKELFVKVNSKNGISPSYNIIIDGEGYSLDGESNNKDIPFSPEDKIEITAMGFYDAFKKYGFNVLFG